MLMDGQTYRRTNRQTTDASPWQKYEIIIKMSVKKMTFKEVLSISHDDKNLTRGVGHEPVECYASLPSTRLHRAVGQHALSRQWAGTCAVALPWQRSMESDARSRLMKNNGRLGAAASRRGPTLLGQPVQSLHRSPTVLLRTLPRLVTSLFKRLTLL